MSITNNDFPYSIVSGTKLWARFVTKEAALKHATARGLSEWIDQVLWQGTEVVAVIQAGGNVVPVLRRMATARGRQPGT